MLQILETPRDAMQGINEFISTESKISYLNLILKAGFDIIDVGSFVSPRAIPQLRDTSEVVRNLETDQTETRLLAIIGNLRGANDAIQHDSIHFLGYPHSISERFLELNLRSSLEKSRGVLSEILNVSDKAAKEVMVYLSMAFGNPYGEDWSPDAVLNECEVLQKLGVHHISLADTIGAAKPEQIAYVFRHVTDHFPEILFGFHLHTIENSWYAKIDAAYKNGCKRFDGVINGMGGCPLSGYELVGNLKTGHILEYMEKNNLPHRIDRDILSQAREQSKDIMEMAEA